MVEEDDQEASGSNRRNGDDVPLPSTSSKPGWKASVEEAQKRYAELFSPHWAKTTILVWAIWTIFTLAYTMVNIFLPKYLSDRSGKAIADASSSDADSRRQNMESVMQEFLFYSLASLPGSLMGAYLIETSLGRIKSMAISTALLALALLTFAYTTITRSSHCLFLFNQSICFHFVCRHLQLLARGF